MTKTWRLASLLMLAVTASVAAQRPVRAQAPTPHVRNAPTAPTGKSAAETRGAESAEHLNSFRGIAAKLGMTTTALQTAYETALKTSPKLTRGQFIAANMLGHNLSAKGITTDQILAGLASGKSIGQTLHSLGLSDKEADAAEKEAERDVREADKAADKAAHDKTQDPKAQAKPDSAH